MMQITAISTPPPTITPPAVPPIATLPAAAPPTATPETSVVGSIWHHLEEMNARHQKADELVQRYAAGDDVDLHHVILATEEARTGMSMFMQVRNKLIDAYQEVMRMQM